MRRIENYDLGAHNTFGMKVKCALYIEYESIAELQALDLKALPQPVFHIGAGSNLLFTKDFPGTVLHSGVKFLKYVDMGLDEVLLTVGSGVVFDDFVAEVCRQGLWGAENLSLIPGEVGASAVQNIGAYGVEVKDILAGVVCLDTSDMSKVVFKTAELAYGYRDSFFKHNRGKYIVTSVLFRLTRKYSPKLEYGNIKAALEAKEGALTPQDVRDAARQEEVNPGKGRPNRWAATSMKASVYITIASLLDSPDDNFWDNDKPGRTPDFSGLGIRTADDAYRLAYNTAENVIQNGPYSLVPDYRTLFRWSEAGDWFLPERIISLESTPEAGQNYNSVRMLPQYPEGSANTVTENRNWGRVRPSRFLIDNFIRVGGGFKGTEETTQDIYQTTTDPRYDASFFTSFLNQSTQKTVKTYPLVIVSSSDATAFPYYKKYLDPSYDVTNGKADFYLIRLAELYLISAEASAGLCNSIGDNFSQRALDRLNDIRRRAR